MIAVTDSDDHISIVGRVGDVVAAGVGYIADWVSRIINGIAGLVPLVALGCTSGVS